MLPDYAMSGFCKFHCNGRFTPAPVVLSLCDFFPVHFTGLIEEQNHPACALFRFGRLLFLARKTECKPDILKSGSVAFGVGPGGSFIDVAT